MVTIPLQRTSITGLYRADDGALYFMDDFGTACSLSLETNQRITQDHINGMAALAGKVY